MEESAAQKVKMFCGKNIETALHALSLTLVPRELPRGGSLLVSLSRAEKSADGCIAARFFTPYSSTASGPPSLTREGFCKSHFWAIDGSAFCDQNELGPPRTSVPTIKKDNRRMCGGDRYDLGRPHGKPASFLRKHCGRPYNQNIEYRTNR